MAVVAVFKFFMLERNSSLLAVRVLSIVCTSGVLRNTADGVLHGVQVDSVVVINLTSGVSGLTLLVVCVCSGDLDGLCSRPLFGINIITGYNYTVQTGIAFHFAINLWVFGVLVGKNVAGAARFRSVLRVTILNIATTCVNGAPQCRDNIAAARLKFRCAFGVHLSALRGWDCGSIPYALNTFVII